MEYTEQYMRSIDEALADEEFMVKLSKAEIKEVNSRRKILRSSLVDAGIVS